MKLTTAIELLHELGTDAIEQLDPAFQDALQIGIEAMKWIKFHRYEEVDIPQDLLPGETEE